MHCTYAEDVGLDFGLVYEMLRVHRRIDGRGSLNDL